MSFLEYREKVQEKDTVILCRGYEKMFPVRVERGKVIQIKGGAIHHDVLIGKQYGSKVLTSNRSSWVLVLHPTPELWTLCLPHRTQIVYSTDSALITLLLGLRPGSKVIEAGTGSGGLTHAMARSVTPGGHLYTFEFHQQRAAIAREEFKQHGLSDIVTLTCQDVCTDGFHMVEVADAVFLDVPKPWEAIEAARRAMKPGGSFCSFSPCMEQVQRTSDQLRACGFSDLEVLECLLRPHIVKAYTLTIPDVGVAHEVLEGWVIGDNAAMVTGEPEEGCEVPPGSGMFSPSLGSYSMWTTQPTNKIPGHTGYLTMATLY